MVAIKNARVLILATDGYERSELRVPFDKLREAGASVKIASLKTDPIKSWDEKDWGDTIDVDLTVDQVSISDFDCLVLPGGQINPDVLRKEEKAVDVVKQFVSSGKIVAAICHAPWLLIEADAVKSRDATSYGSIRTDMINAGANWKDEAVVTDEGIITSRSPEDLDAFVAKIIEEIGEGRHERHAA